MTEMEKLIEGVRALKDKLDANFALDGAPPLTWADVRELAPKIFPYLPLHEAHEAALQSMQESMERMSTPSPTMRK
jgi:hypothetical protein